MKLWISLFLALSGGGIVLGVYVRRRWLAHDAVSQDWLKDDARRGDRIEFHGQIVWPIDKQRNELGWRNRYLLSTDRQPQERKRA